MRRLFPNVYEGWLVVAASAFYITLVSGAINYGFGTIFIPLREEFGWSVAATAFAFSVRQEASGIAAPLVGMINDRFGPQRTVILGVFVVFGAVLGLSFIQNIWQFYFVMLMISVGTSSVGGAVGMAAVSTWFQRRRATAFALMTIGGGLAGVMVVPIAALVGYVGWRDAVRLEAVALLVAGIVPASTTRFRPPDHPQPMDGAERVEDGQVVRSAVQWGIPAWRAVRTPSFVMLSLGLAAISFSTATVTVLQIPFLESVGFPTGVAAFTVSFYALSSVAGRLGFGILADRFNARVILAACMVMSAVGLVLLPFVTTLWQVIGVLLLLGPGIGGTVPVRSAMIAEHYGSTYFGTINGIAVFVRTIGSALGPLLVGFAVDQTGTYLVGWLAAAVIMIVGLGAVAFERPPTALQAEWRGRAEARRAAEADPQRP
ncbi:MAG: MFS transporter [Chloroflexota bacterium]